MVHCGMLPRSDDTSTIERVVKALRERPKGAELLVAGNMNINLEEPEGDRREEDIVATLATEVLEDMAAHLLPRRRRWSRDGRMWSMLQKGRDVRSLTDYILGTDHRLFGMSPSGTLGKTQTITWCWVACQAPPRRAQAVPRGPEKSTIEATGGADGRG